MMFLKLALLFITFDLISGDLSQRGAYVDTNQGGLIGKILKSRNGHTFFEFLGIPYGKIPGRFQISEPADSWKGVRDATNYGPNCIQINENRTVSGVEGCLFLNVFKPETAFKQWKGNETRKLAVIFSIGFTKGAGDSLPQNLIDQIDQDVIIVTPNYRLGPMGFLNAGVKNARGNQGLKDLVLALRWVKENIDKFGGDPDKVVIQGTASASHAVSYLTLSPMAKGLFSGAISQGGTALCPLTKQFKPSMAISNAKKLANLLDCPSSNPEYLVKCLERLDAKIILESTSHPSSIQFENNEPAFGPSLETYQNGELDTNVFLSQDPYEILQEGTFNRVPYILGINSNDGVRIASKVLRDPALTERLNSEWGRVAPITFQFEEYARDPCEISGQIRDFYFQGRHNISSEDVKILGNIYADRLISQCTRTTALLYSKYAPTYLYNFTKDGSDGDLEMFGEVKGSTLGQSDENRTDYPNGPNQINNQSLDYDYSEKLARLWTNFAKHGEPGCDFCNGKAWPKFSPNSSRLHWFTINEFPEVRAEDYEFTKRMNFWENLHLNETFTKPDAINNITEEIRSIGPSANLLYNENGTSSTPMTMTTSKATFGPSSTTIEPSNLFTSSHSRSSSTSTTTNSILGSSPTTKRPWNSPTSSESLTSTESSPPFKDKISTTTINSSTTIRTSTATIQPFSTTTTTKPTISYTTDMSVSSQESEFLTKNNSSTLNDQRTGRENTFSKLKVYNMTLSQTGNDTLSSVSGSMMTLQMPIVMSQKLENVSIPIKNTTSNIKISTHFAFNGTLVLSLLFPFSYQNSTGH